MICSLPMPYNFQSIQNKSQSYKYKGSTLTIFSNESERNTRTWQEETQQKDKKNSAKEKSSFPEKQVGVFSTHVKVASSDLKWSLGFTNRPGVLTVNNFIDNFLMKHFLIFLIKRIVTLLENQKMFIVHKEDLLDLCK